MGVPSLASKCGYRGMPSLGLLPANWIPYLNDFNSESSNDLRSNAMRIHAINFTTVVLKVC